MSNAIGSNEIGPSFGAELEAAGLTGLPFSWGADGTFEFGEAMTLEQRQAVLAVYAAHNPVAARLKAYAADLRWRKETGGIVVGDLPVATDRQSQSMIAGAAMMAQISPETFSTQWKASDGSFVALDAAGMMGIAQAVGAHVAACFAAEALAVEGIDADPPQITMREQIDALFV